MTTDDTLAYAIVYTLLGFEFFIILVMFACQLYGWWERRRKGL